MSIIKQYSTFDTEKKFLPVKNATSPLQIKKKGE